MVVSHGFDSVCSILATNPREWLGWETAELSILCWVRRNSVSCLKTIHCTIFIRD